MGIQWVRNCWLRYTHRHNYELVASAEYIHVNKFTGVEERFPAVWLRCACGKEKAEAVVTSFSVTVHIPIDPKNWKWTMVALKKAEQVPKDGELIRAAENTAQPTEALAPRLVHA